MTPNVLNISLTLLFLSHFATACDDHFLIVNPQTGFVLGASDDFIKLQKITVQDTQLWKLEPARNGQYYIVNKATGKLLDTDFRWSLRNSYVTLGQRLSTFQALSGTKCDDSCQKWYVHHGGNIVNACGTTAFAVDSRGLLTNVKVETLPLGESQYQVFAFQYVNSDCNPI